MSEPAVVKQKCFFCDQEEIVNFDEHFFWCPHCRAVYTFMMMIERGCEHLPDPDDYKAEECPIVETLPKDTITFNRGKAYILTQNGKQWCSICGAMCIADGW